jgi:hypothetical protein
MAEPALFSRDALPKRPRIARAHAHDWGEFPDGRQCARFRCRACGWDGSDSDGDDWREASAADIRRGIPCPRCNPKEA